MSSTASKALFFILGAASASFITYKVVEKKFKDIADEEIASVKEMYERKMKKVETEKKEEVEVTTLELKPEHKVNPYSSLVNGLGYTNNSEEKEDMTDDNIQVIPPEDFGEYDYKTESLTYYEADKVLAYDTDEKITDINKIIGSDALNTFGEYEDDSVFVRNHTLKTDYEILKDTRKYSDVVGTDVDDDE